MNTDRLDSKAVDKISGPSWDTLRPAFSDVSDALLNVAVSATGKLTTIYIKYSSPETSGNPFGVVWVKKASEIVVGLSLPNDVNHERIGDPPKGCKYAGLTKYITIKAGDDVPRAFTKWAEAAYRVRCKE